MKLEQLRQQAKKWKPAEFPARHLHTPDLAPVPFHKGQELCHDATTRYIVMAAGTQGGKDLALDTLIATPNGMVQMRDIKKGDIVYTRTGKTTTVIDTSPIFTDHKCFKLTFDDGNTVIAGEEHQWIVRNASTGDKLTGEVVICTKELYDGFVQGLRWTIDATAPIYGNSEADLPIHPYVLGVWLAKHEHPPLDKYNPVFLEKLRNLKLIKNRHIPEAYFHGDLSARRSLLAGLLDKHGKAERDGTVTLQLTCEKLASDTARLACSLGAKAFVRKKNIYSFFKKIGVMYEIRIHSKLPIAYEQYAESCKCNQTDSENRRFIINIEPTETVETKCISVADSTKSYLITNSYIPTHNTTYGPHWIYDEIYGANGRGKGSGDYLAVTSTYDLFKLKMLPSMMEVLETIYGVARYWAGMKVLELRDPETGEFWAKRADDKMWGRIILRSADALSGLESSTATAAWLDEVGQDAFSTSAYNAIKRRLALRRGRILMTTTLYSYNWFLTRIVKPTLATGKTEFVYSPMGDIDYTVSEETNTSLVQFDSTINPLFSKEEYAEAQNNLSEEEFSMFYRGRETTRRFLIYNNFDPDRHTCKTFHIPEHWKRYVGIDFGGTNTAAVFYAEEPETGILYGYKEYLGGNKTIKEHVAAILSEESQTPLCYGGARGEGQWRTEFAQAGLQVNAPTTTDVDVGISRVYAQHANNGIIYFDNMSILLEQKNSYRRKRLEDGQYSDEIVNKNSYHMLDCERYIISEIRQLGSMRMKVRRLKLGIR